MSTEPTTVLLTGVGIDAGPDIIRALRADDGLNARVVGVDVDAEPPSRWMCDEFETVPRRDDPGYVDAVAEIAGRAGAKVIYPLPTFDQDVFAPRRDELAGLGFAVPVSPPESVTVSNDKWLAYERLRESFPELIPETVRVHSDEELADAAAGLGYPERPVCIRRRSSRGAIGLRILDSGPARLDALLNQNPGSPLASLDEVRDTLAHADPFPEYLVQEYLPGEEWDVDVLADQGEPVIVVTRRTLLMSGGGARVAVLEPNAEAAEAAERIVSELDLHAVVNIAFKPDREGRQKLLEINPRIPSSVLCGLGGGVNLVALAVRQALGERIEPQAPAWGGRFLLHTQSVVTDASGAVVV